MHLNASDRRPLKAQTMIPQSPRSGAAAANLATALAPGRTLPRGRLARALLAALTVDPVARGVAVRSASFAWASSYPPTRRVLSTDRDLVRGESLVRSFQRAGLDARGCADGAAALVEVTDFRPQACVFDLETPGIGGCELAQWVRSEVGGLPFLIGMTSQTEHDLDEVAVGAGFDLLLIWPADTELLVGLLSRHGYSTGV
jgi:CheY-like chemotaxis protein